VDELIYKFLIQSGYPRSSIVSKLTSGLLTAGTSASGGKASALDDCITCLIVDPATADYLGVIAVVGAGDNDMLLEAGSACMHYSKRIDDSKLQCFVIRVDLEAYESDDQVQFFRVADDRQLMPLSVQSFPDIDSLRVSRLLGQKRMVPAVEIIDSTVEDDEEDRDEYSKKRLSAMYLPGLVLLFLAAANWLVNMMTESALFDAGTTYLIIGAAFLLTLPALLRYHRD